MKARKVANVLAVLGFAALLTTTLVSFSKPVGSVIGSTGFTILSFGIGLQAFNELKNAISKRRKTKVLKNVTTA